MRAMDVMTNEVITVNEECIRAVGRKIDGQARHKRGARRR
jgi:hypothetical protein